MEGKIIVESGGFDLVVTDSPDENGGGACHQYEVRDSDTGKVMASVHFQQGPIKECGKNGTPDVLLIEMILHRLKAFQMSPFKGVYNEWGISGLETYLASQESRTKSREARGVEGKNIK